MYRCSFLVLLLLSACTRDCLWVQSEAIRPSFLASERINTPDPRRECPDTGQRLLAFWRLPSSTNMSEGYFLVLALRFGSREERCICVPITRPRGCFIYSLLNEEYFDHCGVHAFKAEIVKDDCVVAEWVHQCWCNLIEIAISDEPDWDQHSFCEDDEVIDFESLSQ